MVRHPLRQQIAVQPEAVASRLVTTDHRRVCWKTQPHLRTGNLVRDHPDRARRDLTDARTLPDAPVNPSFHDR